jgi:hypothetical protein
MATTLPAMATAAGRAIVQATSPQPRKALKSYSYALIPEALLPSDGRLLRLESAGFSLAAAAYRLVVLRLLSTGPGLPRAGKSRVPLLRAWLRVCLSPNAP